MSLLPSKPLIGFLLTLVCEGITFIETWEPSVGEELPCEYEDENIADPFAVTIRKSGVIVGHIPRKISLVCCHYCYKETSEPFSLPHH